MQSVPLKWKWAVCLSALWLVACAATSPAPDARDTPESSQPDLTCLLPSNCVSSRGSGGLAPLRYVGTPAQAMAALQATLKTFAEATIVRSDRLSVSVIFSTPMGFKDEVDFLIDPSTLRVDFRSRSVLGLFDFGKNRSRMQEFALRFERQVRPPLAATPGAGQTSVAGFPRLPRLAPAVPLVQG